MAHRPKIEKIKKAQKPNKQPQETEKTDISNFFLIQLWSEKPKNKNTSPRREN